MESHKWKAKQKCAWNLSGLLTEEAVVEMCVCAGIGIELCFLPCPNPQIIYNSDPS